MKTITKQIRSERKKEAETRQEKYNLLSKEQKLAKLPIEGANKQRAKLNKS